MGEPFRPNLFQAAPSHLSTSQLKTSEPSSASSRRPHLSSLHHHTHRHLHSTHRSSRHHGRTANEGVQSAVQLQTPNTLGDLLKQAKGSRGSTPAGSRRQSVQVDYGIPVQSIRETERDQQLSSGRNKAVRPEDVEREQQVVNARNKELRTSLQTLSDQSLKVSRQLDDTYYALLEKVSTLKQTIGSLQELSGMTRELHKSFSADSSELVSDVGDQIDGFESFDVQQQQVADLETLIAAGREKADNLNARLAEAKGRVEARAASEVEWENRKSRRLRLTWRIIGLIIALVLAAMLLQHFRPPWQESAIQSAEDASVFGPSNMPKPVAATSASNEISSANKLDSEQRIDDTKEQEFKDATRAVDEL